MAASLSSSRDHCCFWTTFSLVNPRSASSENERSGFDAGHPLPIQLSLSSSLIHSVKAMI
jgi:hypothetical protein